MSSVAPLQDTRGNVDYYKIHDVGKSLALLILSARISMFANYYKGIPASCTCNVQCCVYACKVREARKRLHL